MSEDAPKTRPPEVLDGATFVARIRDRLEPCRLLFVRERVFANPTRAVYGAIRMEPFALVTQGCVQLEDESEMITMLEECYSVRLGHFEAWRIAWTVDEGPFFLITSEGVVLWRIEGDVLIGDDRRVELADVAAAEVYAGGDWIEQGVRLRMKDGGYVVMNAVQNMAAEYDWGYDGINLAWDTAWAVRLARAFAETLGVPYENAA